MDDDFALGADRNLVAVLVADLDIERLDHTAGRSEHGVAFRVGGDDRGRLGNAVALENRNSDGIEIPLELDVQKGAATDEELHPASEIFTDFREYDLVEQGDERFLPALEEATAVVIFLIVGNGKLESEIVELLDSRAGLPDTGLYVLLEVAGKSRNREHDVRSDLLDGHRHVLQCGQRVGSDRYGGDAAAVGHHGVEACHVCETVVERKQDEHRRIRLDADDGMRLFHIGRVVAVGQEDSLRICSGTRSVADGGDVVRADRFVTGLELSLVVQKPAVAKGADPFEGDSLFSEFSDIAVHHDDLLDIGKLVEDVADLREKLTGDDNEPRLGMVDSESQVIALLKLVGERDIDSAGIEDTEFGKYPVVAAFREKRDSLALLETHCHETSGDAVTLLAGFFE